MSEVENKTPSESGREYDLITSLVLRDRPPWPRPTEMFSREVIKRNFS